MMIFPSTEQLSDWENYRSFQRSNFKCSLPPQEKLILELSSEKKNSFLQRTDAFFFFAPFDSENNVFGHVPFSLDPWETPSQIGGPPVWKAVACTYFLVLTFCPVLRFSGVLLFLNIFLFFKYILMFY